MIVHHGYFRSSSSYRLRIALNLKGLASEYRPVHLLKDGGQHRSAAFQALNPQKLLPVLEVGDTVLTQSPAILEWLEEVYPDPALLPTDVTERARVRAFCAVIACEVHPLQNLRVLQYLETAFNGDQSVKAAWGQRWIGDGLAACEGLVADRAKTAFCFGDAPGLADVYLMPQIYAAERFGVDLTEMPRLRAVGAECAALPAIQKAHPSVQPDAE